MTFSSDEPVQVLVIHDDPATVHLLSDELVAENSIELLAAAISRREGKRIIDQHQFDVLLIAPVLKDGNGYDLITYAKQIRPLCEVIVLGRDDGEAAMRAFACGAMGYVPCQGPSGRYAHAVKQVANGGAYMTSRMSRLVLNHLDSQWTKQHQQQEMEQLTTREKQVLKMVADGRTSPQVGIKLDIAGQTVNTHVKNILRKLKVRTRAQAISIAYERGLL